MRKDILLIFLLVLLCSSEALAQEGIGSLISPGKLTSSHAKYDGITSCTKCHALGGGIPDSKCLDCHDKLAERITKKEGVHARYTDACIKCHTDHKGGSFKIVSLEKDKFDHKDTDYPLLDKHSIVKCEKCHKKGGSYTGLSQECISCHKDKHKGELDRDCERCHNIKGWKEIEKFNHDRDSKYVLTGKHIEVKCEKCHVKSRYRVDKFEECRTCHKDPHKGKPKCKECHTTESWKKVPTDHSKTKYPLTDKHIQVKCDKCHKNNQLTGIPFKTCNNSDCHDDPHKRQFADQVCEACHNIKGWKPSLFDHNAPGYAGYRLDGKHLKTSCEKCHLDGKYKPLPDRCYDCHEKDDTHKKELGNNCVKCHDTADWKKSTLDHNRQTNFPLIGKHKGTECEKCHENKRYKTKAEKCIDCHKDIHKGEFKEECGSCHTQNDWFPRKFNHKKEGGIELKGVHNDIVCTSCHKTKGEYKGVSRFCGQCHADPHFNQFGIQNCTQCHSEKTWNPTQFDHSKTGYPLIGRHRTAECQDCHRNRVYRNTSTACVSCHLNQYSSARYHVANSFSQNCTDCHNTAFTAWPFDHHRVAKDCFKCHLIIQPASHASNAVKYPATCETCHRYPAWTSFTHPTTSAGCSSCHVADKPPTHTTKGYGDSCETCHKSKTAWTYNHTGVTKGCSTCHLNDRPASHAGNTAKYATICENCHKYPAWTTVTHPSVTSGCSSCHLSTRPASHSSNTTRYSTTCENCHKSTTTWTSHIHPSATTSCSRCHLTNSTPAKPASHTTNNWTTCETCHKSTTTWAFTHPTTTFPLNHHTSATNCSACHPGGAYTNKGGCTGCHGNEHNKGYTNTQCLNCHPTGRK